MINFDNLSTTDKPFFLVFRFFCHGLITGESYVFRVRALNAAGLSECSQESEAIEVKAAIGESVRVYLTQHNDMMKEIREALYEGFVYYSFSLIILAQMSQKCHTPLQGGFCFCM